MVLVTISTKGSILFLPVFPSSLVLQIFSYLRASVPVFEGCTFFLGTQGKKNYFYVQNYELVSTDIIYDTMTVTVGKYNRYSMAPFSAREIYDHKNVADGLK